MAVRVSSEYVDIVNSLSGQTDTTNTSKIYQICSLLQCCNPRDIAERKRKYAALNMAMPRTGVCATLLQYCEIAMLICAMKQYKWWLR